MAEKYFKYLVYIFFGISLLAIFSGLFNSSPDHFDVQVTQLVSADKGLDLKAVGKLLEGVKDGEDFERKLNAPGSGVNNLDLNEDGQVDYINVTEFGEGSIKGFALSTKPDGKEVQELATIKIEKQGEDQAKVEVKGNESIYGDRHYYHSSWGGGGFFNGILMGYLFSSFHRPWSSPWGYGNYPSYHRPYSTLPYGSYRRKTDQYTRGSPYTSGSSTSIGGPSSPYQGKNASQVKAPLKNPTLSQKSFQKRNPSKQIKARGFGRSGRASTFGSKRGFGRSSSVRGFGRSGGLFRGK